MKSSLQISVCMFMGKISFIFYTQVHHAKNLSLRNFYSLIITFVIGLFFVSHDSWLLKENRNEKLMEQIGAIYSGKNTCKFGLYSPFFDKLILNIVSSPARQVPLVKNEKDYWSIFLEDIAPDTRYFYRLSDNTDRPDPVSFYQPEDVSGPSCVIDHSSFMWDDQDWNGDRDYVNRK